MLANEDHREPLWRVLLVIAAPIIVGEACLAVRSWIKREHKAALRRREETHAARRTSDT